MDGKLYMYVTVVKKLLLSVTWPSNSSACMGQQIKPLFCL